jgi:Family of unknown function (DUF6152)
MEAPKDVHWWTWRVPAAKCGEAQFLILFGGRHDTPAYRVPALLAAAVLFTVSGAAKAHHSFAAEFDADKPVQVTGSVTKAESTNPHVRFYIDVKDSDGNVANWNIELGRPLILQRLGRGHD